MEKSIARSLSAARGGGTGAESREGLAQVLQKGFGVVNVRINPGLTIRGDGLDFVQFELARDFFDGFRLDGALVVDECVDESVFAEQVDDARDTK